MKINPWIFNVSFGQISCDFYYVMVGSFAWGWRGLGTDQECQ